MSEYFALLDSWKNDDKFFWLIPKYDMAFSSSYPESLSSLGWFKPCNSVFGENYFFFKLDFVLSNL